MKNFKTKILTYNGNMLTFDALNSYVNLKTYKNGSDRVTITSSQRGQTYIVEIKRRGEKDNKQFIQVHSRRGVYAALTYYEILEDNEEISFINSQYGSMQNYLDNICCTSEYIAEKYNIRGN